MIRSKARFGENASAMAAQNPNLLSPLSPPSTPLAEGGDGPPPLPDRKPANHSTFKFPGIKRHSPFSSPRGSPRTSPSPSPRTSPFASPRTSPVGSPINIQRKVPPPLPPSDYDTDEPPIIPPKPSMAQVRSSYQSRRVNSNPQGFVTDAVKVSASNSRNKQLSKSHDLLPTTDKEEESELSHSLPDQETSTFEECTLADFETSAYKPSIPDHKGDRSLIEKPEQAQHVGNLDSNRSVINEESKRIQSGSGPLPHPPIPAHRSAPDGAGEPSHIAPLYSTVGQGFDDGGSKDMESHPSPVRPRPRPRKNQSDPIIKGTSLKNALDMSETSQSPVAPARTKRSKPKTETVPDLLSHIDHETLGARPRQCPEEFRPELPNPFAPVPDLFMNSLYEPLYLAGEPHLMATKGEELSQLQDDRRHSCPVKAESHELEQSHSWNRTATLNRSKSKLNENLHDTGILDPKRPVPIPPGKSFKELERRYSSETTGADVTSNRDTDQDSNHHSENVDNDHAAALDEIYDQPVPILPVKKRQSIKKKQPDIVIEEDSNKLSKERVGPVKKDVYYTLPQDIPPVKEMADNTDFYESDDRDASELFYEFPTKVISEQEPEETGEGSSGGNVGFEDDFSTMFPSIKRTASDPFRNDDFFSVPSSNAQESQTVGSSEESPDPSPPSRPPRSTKQVNGESVTIGKDEKIDSFVDQRTGRTMVAGPGRFFRPGQATGRERPIEFYEEDFNILMAQGYSREQITRALVIAENNFALARKILKEFAAPNK